MSVMEVMGTLDEVIQLFQTRTTAQAKAHAQRFGKQLLDAVKLYSLVEPTCDAPTESIGVTWRAYRSPLSLFVAKRDACTVDCTHAFTLDGRPGWVSSSKSVTLSCCPELTHLAGFVRMINYGSGHVFLESATRPGYIELRYIAQLDFRGTSFNFVSDAVLKRREWVSDINMTKRCRNLLDIDRFLREDRLRVGVLLEENQLVPKAARKHCYVCTVRFGWNQHKSNCYKCGQVVCSNCNSDWCLAGQEGNTRTFKACVKCAMVPANRHVSGSFSSGTSSVTHVSDACWDFSQDLRSSATCAAILT
ncbi:Aste57867_7120 [Aphanomyces stellatus]|nr:hypothetical protein As57867_007096 [Aphanomyces stellatus]VFT84052.1 Aste57867_7120 [Aphanomyces stellatus]